MTEPSTAVRIQLLSGEPTEMAELQRVLEGAPVYADRVTGLPPGHSDAENLCMMLPDGKSYDDKFVYGVYRGTGMVGCADLIRGYPNARTAHIGLLLIAEQYQRQGLGRRAYELLEQIVRAWGTCEKVRIGVVGTNEDVIPFWSRQGFQPTGEVRPYHYGRITSETFILEKLLPGLTPGGI